MKARILILVAILFAVTNVQYGITGKEILEEMENTLTGPEDMEATVKMTLADSDGGNEEEREMKMWVAGEDTRMIKFISPSSVKNIGMLALGDNEMYLYMPNTRTVRRISGSAQNDDFQGTDFSYKEIGSYDYSDDFEADIESEDDDTWTLNLNQFGESDSDYDQIIMVVNKDNYVPKQVDMYTDGELIKTMNIYKTETIDGYIFPTHVKVESFKNNHYTEMEIEDPVFDQGLMDDDFFTQRQLKRSAD